MMITKAKQEEIYGKWFDKFDSLNLRYSHSIDKLDIIKASSIFKLLECSPRECVSMFELMSQHYYTFLEFRFIIGAVLDFDRQYVFKEYLGYGMNDDLVKNDRDDYVLWHYDEIDFEFEF
jgi:hypothetical protein